MAERVYVPVLHGAALDRPDEQDTLIAAEAAAAALRRLGYRTDIVHLGLDLTVIDRLAAAAPACVFNMVDAIDGDCALAPIAPAMLAHRHMRYTGADATAWQTMVSKIPVKQRLAAAGLPTPAWSLDGTGLPDGSMAIVKSLVEHASFGIDAASVVPAADAAREIAAREARFGGTFFAEAYIPGREFNISVLEGAAGPVVLPPAEIEFVGFAEGRPHIVDYDAKWMAGSDAFDNTPRRLDFPDSDAVLLQRVRTLSSLAWRAFGLRGYARVDFRVDELGMPWILEININPCLTPDAGFVAAAGRAGFSFDALIGHIVSVTTARNVIAV